MPGRHVEDQCTPQKHERRYDRLRWFWFALLATPVVALVLAFLGYVLLVILAQMTGPWN